MGEMLKQVQKNTGAKGVGPIAVPDGNRNTDAPPTYAEQGISKKQAMQARAEYFLEFSARGNARVAHAPASRFASTPSAVAMRCIVSGRGRPAVCSSRATVDELSRARRASCCWVSPAEVRSSRSF